MYICMCMGALCKLPGGHTCRGIQTHTHTRSCTQLQFCCAANMRTSLSVCTHFFYICMQVCTHLCNLICLNLCIKKKTYLCIVNECNHMKEIYISAYIKNACTHCTQIGTLQVAMQQFPIKCDLPIRNVLELSHTYELKMAAIKENGVRGTAAYRSRCPICQTSVLTPTPVSLGWGQCKLKLFIAALS